jgi:hypothetical protein
MAIARLHGGPLDGQMIPLDDEAQDRLILPYSETQVVYTRDAAAGEGDGEPGVDFRFEEAEGAIDPDSDDDDIRSER